MNPEIRGNENDETVAAHFRELLLEAARIHLRSDVAVGTCLSGGIDSSTLTVLINTLIRSEAPESVGARQKTFSVVFSDTKFDESRYIDEVVAATGVDADRTEPAPDQLWDDIDRRCTCRTNPSVRSPSTPSTCVMRLAAKKVKVVLDGQGADELIAGYLGYQGSYIRGLLRTYHWGTALREIAGSLREHRDFFQSARQQLHVRRTRRGLLKCTPETIDRYQGTLDEVLHRELLSTNLPALLHYEDRNAMAFSLESRVPDLDVRLVEYVASLPLSQKVRAVSQKLHCVRPSVARFLNPCDAAGTKWVLSHRKSAG